MKFVIRWFAIALLGLGSPSFAGVFTDDLARCLVEKTTADDRTTLVRWIFVAMSQHTSVTSMTKVTPEDVTMYNRQAGELFTRLLADDCGDLARKAIKNEGIEAIQVSFQSLGQSAATELMAHPDVTKVMAGLQQFLDAKKLEALVK